MDENSAWLFLHPSWELDGCFHKTGLAGFFGKWDREGSVVPVGVNEQPWKYHF